MTNKNNQENSFENLLELESYLEEIQEGSPNAKKLKNLRSIAKEAIRIHSNGKIDSNNSFSKVLKAAHDNSYANRFSALLVLRMLSVPNALPNSKDDSHIEQCIAQLVENSLPDFNKIFKFSEVKQTYEKISKMEKVHVRIMDHLLPLKNMPTIMADIVSQKEEVYRAINNKLVKSYLVEYDYSNIRNQIRAFFDRAENLLKIENEKFGTKLDELKNLVDDHIKNCISAPTFFSQGYYLPLLRSFETATNKLDKDSTKKLDCSIKTKKTGNFRADKKYPFDETGREVKVIIPLINTGPGIAHDVNATIYCIDEAVAINEVLNLGDIRPGEFPFALNILIIEPIKKISLDVELSWKIMGQIEPKTTLFSCDICAQNPDIDWESLLYEQPYSTAIAEGDEFVGRKKKVTVLARRLLTPRMQSSYITGQKRVGKTSLAYAVVHAIESVEQGKNIEIKYIEWGDIAHSNPEKSVEALGKELKNFFDQFLPSYENTDSQTFQASLAPLNAIANNLRDMLPKKKFLIILDEFDEIPKEMYRHGPLAEAFFSNIRTLSSKSNMAFILVGGEKMPFIMGAQGDQLNKFIGEQLDYFSKTDEYDDYKQLVEEPVNNLLTWSDEAIEKIFILTNGHPFYTKLICSSVFDHAVSTRDSDISVRDIKFIVTRITNSLTVNQFAHYWKDGVSKIEEEESVSLDRCRVLVAIGRTMRRHHTELSFNDICENNHSTKLGEHQIKPILDDFCRRDILQDKNGVYLFVMPLFGMWLEETGVDKLITDRLGDELANSIRDDEEKARVSSSEILELVDGWFAYRGREITSDNVRSWIEQLESLRDQRLLFTLLENLLFVTEIRIREKLKIAHQKVRQMTPTIVTRSKRQKRNDIIVTYVDGEAKSGQYYASLYAEENKISVSCVISPIEFSKRVVKHEEKNNITVNGIVIVDDLVATGGSLSGAVKTFVEENSEFIKTRSIKLVVVALFATKQGAEKVEKTIESLDCENPELQIMDLLEDRHYAFADDPGIWNSNNEFQKAKALCVDLGTQIYKKAPLGFGNMGLLVVFPSTCPNNTLPIIHGSSINPTWAPLFPRPVN